MQKLTVLDKINKILAYCEYTKYLANNEGNEVRYIAVIENTDGWQDEESEHIVYGGDTRTFLHSAICKAVLAAKQYSQDCNCLSSVKVYIETYNSKCKLIDEDPIDEYEIIFENGIEV